MSKHLKVAWIVSLAPLYSSMSHPLCNYLTFSLYLLWSASVSKVIASSMESDSAMVTAGTKPSVKIITAPC